MVESCFIDASVNFLLYLKKVAIPTLRTHGRSSGTQNPLYLSHSLSRSSCGITSPIPPFASRKQDRIIIPFEIDRLQDTLQSFNHFVHPGFQLRPVELSKLGVTRLQHLQAFFRNWILHRIHYSVPKFHPMFQCVLNICHCNFFAQFQPRHNHRFHGRFQCMWEMNLLSALSGFSGMLHCLHLQNST